MGQVHFMLHLFDPLICSCLSMIKIYAMAFPSHDIQAFHPNYIRKAPLFYASYIPRPQEFDMDIVRGEAQNKRCLEIH